MKTYKLSYSILQQALFPLVPLGLLFYAFVVPEPQNILLRLLLIFIAVAFVFNFPQVLGYIEYDKISIKMLKIFREPTFIKWDDVAIVKSKFTSLQLSDQNENRLINIDLNLRGAEHFFEYLSQMSPNIFILPLGEKLRHKPFVLGMVIFLLVAIGVVSYWFVSQFSLFLGIVISVVFFSLAVVEFGRSIRDITLERDKLTVKSISTSKKYPINKIKSIDLVVKRTHNTNNYYIHISVTAGKPIKLGLKGHVPIILYWQLRSWFDKVKQMNPSN